MNASIQDVDQAVDSAYGELRQAIDAEFQAADRVTVKKAYVATERMLIISSRDPKELGSNETSREATINQMLSRDTDELRKLERDLAAARNFTEKCRLNVERLKQKVKLYECAAHVGCLYD